MMQDFGNRLLFQLALTTECIGCTNIILTLTLSFQLALTTECIRQIFRFSNCFNSFNSHPLWSVSDKDPHEQIGKYISTRTLYGVYLFVILNILASRSFQLALTTECIKRRNAQRKTIYFFNSHPLRSVSSHKGICSYVRYLSTRTRYGVYHLWSRCFCPL